MGISVCANICFFFFVGREIHETLSTAPKTDRSEKMKEFRVYVSIATSIGLSWIFGFLMLLPNCIVQTIFLFLFSFTTPLQGFLIFASYCYNDKIIACWARKIGMSSYADKLENPSSRSNSNRSERPSQRGSNKTTSQRSSASRQKSTEMDDV